DEQKASRRLEHQRRNEERARRQAQEAPAPPVTEPDPTPTSSPEVDEMPSLISELIDPSLPIEDARVKLRERIRPNEPFVVSVRHVHNKNFNYTITLSPQVLDVMLNPKPKEPQDFRDWMRAL